MLLKLAKVQQFNPYRKDLGWLRGRFMDGSKHGQYATCTLLESLPHLTSRYQPLQTSFTHIFSAKGSKHLCK